MRVSFDHVLFFLCTHADDERGDLFTNAEESVTVEEVSLLCLISSNLCSAFVVLQPYFRTGSQSNGRCQENIVHVIMRRSHGVQGVI